MKRKINKEQNRMLAMIKRIDGGYFSTIKVLEILPCFLFAADTASWLIAWVVESFKIQSQNLGGQTVE